MHAAFRALPCVDISPLYSPDAGERVRAASKLGAATREAGFFYVTGHRVPALISERLLAQSQAFFRQPLERKMAYYIGNSPNHRGYVPQGEEVFYGGSRDGKEAFDLSLELPADDPDVLAGTPMLGPNVWPELPGFRMDVGAYYDAVFELGRVLFRGFALALGLPEFHFEAYLDKPPSQLRLIHYPAMNGAEQSSGGIAPHTDYECFTILLSSAAGLEVMNGQCEWIDAPPLPGAFVVNIGDMLEAWTNGEFVATSHRVRRVQQERYSFPLFFACDYATVVEPLPAFVTPDRKAAYPPIVAGEHLFAQTVQTFAYLKRRLERGECALPVRARPLASFGQQARTP